MGNAINTTSQHRSLSEFTTNTIRHFRTLFPSHTNHLTRESPWPIHTSGAVLSMLSSAALWFNGVYYSGTVLLLCMLSTVAAMTLWWADVNKEGTTMGHHTRVVQNCLAIGVALFIVTEASAFLSIFWAYFHSSLAPTVELGTQWPPVGVMALSPLAVPALNTILLVSSGATVTYAHHALFQKSRERMLQGLLLTVILAIIFTFLQGFEYAVRGFSMTDGAYGSCFYFGTGTHGVHVLVGTIFIAVGLVRGVMYHYTSETHVGLEASILYWHFVDAVWLALYLMVYWWGSY